MHLRDVIRRLFNHIFVDKPLLQKGEDSKSEHVRQISGLELKSFECPYLLHQFSLRVSVRLKNTHSLKKMLSVHLMQVDVEKTFPGMLHKFRMSGYGLEEEKEREVKRKR